jgi:hypothetical protein
MLRKTSKTWTEPAVTLTVQSERLCTWLSTQVVWRVALTEAVQLSAKQQTE